MQNPVPSGSGSTRRWLQDTLPKIVLAPSFAIALFFVYGFIAWTGYLSFSASRMLPNYKWVGMAQYDRLWNTLNWSVALENLAVFGTLYIVICCLIGLFLAILLDQKIRIEGGPRAGDWEVVGVTERKVTLRCPISGREFEWNRFAYLAGEEEAAEWPQAE